MSSQTTNEKFIAQIISDLGNVSHMMEQLTHLAERPAGTVQTQVTASHCQQRLERIIEKARELSISPVEGAHLQKVSSFDIHFRKVTAFYRSKVKRRMPLLLRPENGKILPQEST